MPCFVNLLLLGRRPSPSYWCDRLDSLQRFETRHESDKRLGIIAEYVRISDSLSTQAYDFLSTHSASRSPSSSNRKTSVPTHSPKMRCESGSRAAREIHCFPT